MRCGAGVITDTEGGGEGSLMSCAARTTGVEERASDRVREWALRRRAMRWSCWYWSVRVYGTSLPFAVAVGVDCLDGDGVGVGVLATIGLTCRDGEGEDTASSNSSVKLAKLSVRLKFVWLVVVVRG